MKRSIIIFFLGILCLDLYAGEYSFFGLNSVYLPVEWGVLGSEQDKVTFSDPTQKAFLQIKRYPGNKFDSAESIYRSVLSRLKGTGEGDGFTYETRESYFGNVRFAASGISYEGFVVCIDNKDFDYVLLSFSTSDAYSKFHDFILSAMDSFAFDDAGRLSPGVVSQYYYPFPTPDKKIGYININGKKILYTFDSGELEASQVLVEREARILVTYTKSRHVDEAWIRYYRIIYRDNYLRLSRAAGIISRNISDDFNGLSSFEKSSLLLSWIQSLKYFRTGTLSDFLSPVSCLAEERGDCDSKGLLYVILLKHYGIDAILMVSSAYSHSLAGVAVEGKGAHFTLNGVSYLVAETTDDVSIGLIDRSMADPGKWLGISFP